MLPQYLIKSPPWKNNFELEKLILTLTSMNVAVKIVGGAVRDAITGAFSEETDIDLAVDHSPEEIQKKLKNFKIIPTGVSHGTLTILVGKKTFELTSLRKDISTDGRHAIVEYTKDFLEDAKRRDFTINALYADFDGKVYDPLGKGLSDLKDSRIRFVGNTEKRIQEDFLRIVRFFRFMGYLKSATVDDEDLKICKELSYNLNQISKERLWDELQKIIASQIPIKSLEALINTDIMQYICPGNWYLDAILKIKDWLPHVPDRVFTLLSTGYKSSFDNFPLPIPSKLQNRLHKKIKMKLEFSPSKIYRIGKDTYRDQFICSYIQYHPFTPLTLKNFRAWLRKIDTWQLPTLPISGNILIKKGVTPGPEMGEMLKYVENWWIDQDFKPDEDECLMELERRYGTRFY